MNKYFTKQYIKECDCEEIQNSHKFNVEDHISNDCHHLWLPTGDQLDEEIVKVIDKISKEDYTEYDYEFTYLQICKVYFAEVTYLIKGIRNKNPYIAKILLLKQLIGSKK